MTTHIKEILAVVSVLALSVALYFTINTTPSQPMACTEEARLCPDGSAVGRVGPLCEFAPCPGNIDDGTEGLSVGESKSLDGVTILLTRIVSDSRCPRDVQCIQAGMVTVEVQLDGAPENTFMLSSEGTPIMFGTYSIAITNVLPERVSTRELGTKDYRVSFSVTPQATNIEKPDTVTIPRGPSLDLSNQELTNVSQTIFSRTKLVSLDLSDNKLMGALPGEVRKLSALEWLDLSNNNFTGVPAEIGQLSELRYLDLSNNKLTGLPYELSNLKKLEVLNLSGNTYAKADLAVIKQGLPETVRILGE